MLSILLAVMFMGVMIVAPFAIMIASTNREERREIKSDKEDEDIHKFYELPASEQRIITTQKQVS